jgi:hypothetical protein
MSPLFCKWSCAQWINIFNFNWKTRRIIGSNLWQNIEFLLQVRQKLDALLLEKRGHFFKVKFYCHCFILQWLEVEAPSLLYVIHWTHMKMRRTKSLMQYEYGPIQLNFRSILSSYFLNSSVEFLRRKVHVGSYSSTYITILQKCDEVPTCIMNLITNEFT